MAVCKFVTKTPPHARARTHARTRDRGLCGYKLTNAKNLVKARGLIRVSPCKVTYKCYMTPRPLTKYGASNVDYFSGVSCKGSKVHPKRPWRRV